MTRAVEVSGRRPGTGRFVCRVLAAECFLGAGFFLSLMVTVGRNELAAFQSLCARLSGQSTLEKTIDLEPRWLGLGDLHGCHRDDRFC
jgi:hypothetical protein